MVVLSRDLTNLSFENALSALVDVRGSVKAIFISFGCIFACIYMHGKYFQSANLRSTLSREIIYEIIDWCILYFQANFPTLINS